MAESIIFYSLAAVIVASALFTVLSKNIFHSALWLALSLFGVAGIYVVLNSHFLAGIQVLIYIGAIVVLAIFAINLTKSITGKDIPQMNGRTGAAFVVSAAGLFIIVSAVLKSAWGAAIAKGPAAGKTELIGKLLVGDFVIPFEVVSVLLLAALTGAVVIISRAKEDGE
ncbi:MAG TPA: NADH-quinone oxidoreductase subunit J [Firmicutes bacterium]|nr:NADH-quinone oxidoreductase subunit J [Bacillota bacterium]